ncbi:hypothetical protein MRX96_015369 [Rhipicephalus microplus]
MNLVFRCPAGSVAQKTLVDTCLRNVVSALGLYGKKDWGVRTGKVTQFAPVSAPILSSLPCEPKRRVDGAKRTLLRWEWRRGTRGCCPRRRRCSNGVLLARREGLLRSRALFQRRAQCAPGCHVAARSVRRWRPLGPIVRVSDAQRLAFRRERRFGKARATYGEIA